MLTKQQMCELLRQDVVPALGCTEPVCVALAAATAADAVKGEVKSLKVVTNPNIYKNGMSVGIPGFSKVGLNYAAAIGAALANPEKSLQLLADLTAEKAAAAAKLAESGNVSVTIDRGKRSLYVACEAVTSNGTGFCEIQNAHTNVTRVSVNGKDVFAKETAAGSTGNPLMDALAQMTVAEIRALVDTADESDLSFLMDGVRMNEGVAAESLAHPSGVGISATLQKEMGKTLKSDLMTNIMLKVASSIEGRLDGCPYTIMSSAGAGSKGLAVILPISEAAKELGSSPLSLMRALAFGHLLNSYINFSIGKLSAMCACSLASATAASAAITYLMGGSDEQIAWAIRNMTGTITGMICDGGKVGCALKLATSLAAGVMSALLAVNNSVLRVSDGVCGETAEDCIRNISRVANPGMLQTDKEILDIMLEKDKK
ncbi:MAG TPA: L-serine ammonia-lyase, iron-sulfur-dependent, subunit alpha [Firmicutes bacterium]|nr:L-serine ammonia-lyase, iron-sulfur-dependent, subunit alpha [Bacillota bacterium]